MMTTLGKHEFGKRSVQKVTLLGLFLVVAAYPATVLARTPPVAGLFFGGSPPAIGWLIGAVHINAVNSEPAWPFAHIDDEALKSSFTSFAKTPSVTNRYTPSAIEFVVPDVGVVATTDHCFPCAIVIASRLSVFLASLTTEVRCETPAGPTLSAAQMTGENSCFLSTLTPAVPSNNSATTAKCNVLASYSGEASKCLATQVHRNRHPKSFEEEGK